MMRLKKFLKNVAINETIKLIDNESKKQLYFGDVKTCATYLYNYTIYRIFSDGKDINGEYDSHICIEVETKS